ncbi:MAG: M15 family metallopeptidase [Clostridiales bacterium]|nr:M15 family metallopeptidase [Clostridiales bacterium]
MAQASTQRPHEHETENRSSEYYVVSRRRRRRRRSRSHPFIYLFLALLLFFGGFLLGRHSSATSETDPPEPSAPSLSLPSPDIDETASPQQPDETVPPEQSNEPVATERPWNLVLVNKDNSLAEDFQVPELTQLQNGHAIDSRAYPALQSMMDAARAEGLQPVICSSFRTWDKQDELFYRKVPYYLDQGYSQEEAEEKAAFWVARPGTSEHQLGLAVDIVDINYQLLDENQESTAVQQWLMNHCMEYGFILRYPTSKSEITGVGYEPWHYRYVGIEAAKEISEQGLCLEEYLQAVPCS